MNQEKNQQLFQKAKEGGMIPPADETKYLQAWENLKWLEWAEEFEKANTGLGGFIGII